MSISPRLNLLPVAIAAIVFITAIPVELRHAVWPNAVFRAPDVFANVLLYVPLGIAIVRRSAGAMLLTALALTVSIEAAQIWMFERFSSLSDVLANVIGTALGFIACRLIEARKSIALDAITIHKLFFPAVIVAPLIALATVPVGSSKLSNWDLEYSLLFGNEQTGDRPWKGTLHSLALLPAALPKDTVRTVADARGWRESGLEATAAYVLPAPLTFDGGPPASAPDDVARQIGEAAARANAFTIVAELQTADIRQRGPARVVSFSRDPLHRNFDLGQDEQRVVFRIRTETTGENANDWRTETPNVLESNRPYVVAATYDGSIARVFLDGELYGRSNLMAAGCPMPVLCDAGRPFARAMLGASVALAVLGWSGPTLQRRALGIAVCAGAASALAQWLLAALFGSSVLSPWLGLLNAAGALCVAIGVQSLPADQSERRASI
jgi:hypothetical protein